MEMAVLEASRHSGWWTLPILDKSRTGGNYRVAGRSGGPSMTVERWHLDFARFLKTYTDGKGSASTGLILQPRRRGLEWDGEDDGLVYIRANGAALAERILKSALKTVTARGIKVELAPRHLLSTFHQVHRLLLVASVVLTASAMHIISPTLNKDPVPAKPSSAGSSSTHDPFYGRRQLPTPNSHDLRKVPGGGI
ncbi:hypothetical protein BT67DRAFT_272303 [Trichocladium antarcticum]|uniref:Uncharacterized protein n=1 Tax=Trichocladium antarcticum TaxID=1450529 RepID=A0AAN6ZDS3_9PEZI|nr:hypothetical protein BT67DRAFT_272303 [Trichocladium antarcticum]